MSVIPFDPERPFPLTARRFASPTQRAAMKAAIAEEALAIVLQENARIREQARVAEQRVEELTMQMMQDDLMGRPFSTMPQAG